MSFSRTDDPQDHPSIHWNSRNLGLAPAFSGDSNQVRRTHDPATFAASRIEVLDTALHLQWRKYHRDTLFLRRDECSSSRLMASSERYSDRISSGDYNDALTLEAEELEIESIIPISTPGGTHDLHRLNIVTFRKSVTSRSRPEWTMISSMLPFRAR